MREGSATSHMTVVAYGDPSSRGNRGPDRLVWTTPSGADGVVTFEEFCRAVSREVQLPTIVDMDPSMRLFDDIGMDSFGSFELVLATEELAGLSAPPSQVPEIHTLGDAYAYFLKCRADVAAGTGT